jgi:hypothetical protein
MSDEITQLTALVKDLADRIEKLERLQKPIIEAVDLSSYFKIDGSRAITGDVTLNAGVDIATSTATGTMIGKTTSQKIGFWGKAPIARGSAFTQTYSTASHTVGAALANTPPAGGTGATAGAYDSALHRDQMITSLTNCITDVANLKQVVNGIIDDLQAVGLLG